MFNSWDDVWKKILSVKKGESKKIKIKGVFPSTKNWDYDKIRYDLKHGTTTFLESESHNRGKKDFLIIPTALGEFKINFSLYYESDSNSPLKGVEIDNVEFKKKLTKGLKPVQPRTITKYRNQILSYFINTLNPRLFYIQGKQLTESSLVNELSSFIINELVFYNEEVKKQYIKQWIKKQ